jgi:hypothetical protein
MGRWDNRICTILVNWNGKKDTLECLDSLAKTDYPKMVTVVVDNGSTDDSVQAIRAAHPQVPVFELKENLGFAGGNNEAISWALRKSFDWILLLNNDTIVAPNLFTALLQTAQEQPNAKIFGAKIFRYHDPKRIDHLGGRWNSTIAEFESLHAGELDAPHSPEPVDYVCGAALFMHRSVPETIGLLEPRYFLFWEETDYCFRARRKNLPTYTAPNAHIWHKVSASFTGGKPHSHYYWWRSRLLWLSRNLLFAERQAIYRQTIRPELFKLLRHYLLKSTQQLFSPNPDRALKIKRLKAGLTGAFHYFLKRFGNCPSWLIK